MARTKRTPHDPSKVHDRRSTDLLRNAMVSPIEVDDPYAVGDKIVVMRSLRNDPLASLHSRRFIDDAQLWGGRSFQRDFEAAERGPRAIDPSKEFVDGGLSPEPITEAQQRAARSLSRVYAELGQNGSAIVSDVLIHGRTITEITVRRGMEGERWEKYFGMRFRECLDCLALIYGFSMDRRTR